MDFKPALEELGTLISTSPIPGYMPAVSGAVKADPDVFRGLTTATKGLRNTVRDAISKPGTALSSMRHAETALHAAAGAGGPPEELSIFVGQAPPPISHDIPGTNVLVDGIYVDTQGPAR